MLDGSLMIYMGEVFPLFDFLELLDVLDFCLDFFIAFFLSILLS